jgi:SCY1-like protein 1
LLRYLAKTANDEQPGIRTNTTICLGKIAKHLGSSSRARVLIAAFTRSLRDPFVHARNASLMALGVTAEYFSEEDCAVRLLPALCPSLIDKEKLIRDQASKTVDVYIAKIKKAAAGMPDTALPPDMAAAGGGGPRMSTPQPAESSAAAAAGWAGWAISSFTNKLSAAAGEIQPSSSPAVPANGGPSAPPPKRPTPATSSSASTLHRQALKSPPPSAPSAKDSFFPDPEPEEDFDDGGDAWGDMDDMKEDEDDNNNNGQDDNPFSSSTPPTTTTTRPKREAKPPTAIATPTPFDDGSEPDFAGWLAAQAQKKSAGKGLPKGMAKAGSGTAKKAPAATSAAKTKVAAKKTKIDMKPKETEEDDGWGGW